MLVGSAILNQLSHLIFLSHRVQENEMRGIASWLRVPGGDTHSTIKWR